MSHKSPPDEELACEYAEGKSRCYYQNIVTVCHYMEGKSNDLPDSLLRRWKEKGYTVTNFESSPWDIYEYMKICKKRVARG